MVGTPEEKSRSAFEQEERISELKFIGVTEKGARKKRIDLDAEWDDINTFWSQQEPTLWMVIIGCCLYFLMVVL